MLTLTILGCGSSGGVPRVGPGGWGVCDPANPKNRRRRCSILIERRGPDGTTVVLVDTSPDLREQLLDAGVDHLDAVVLTHPHADHTHGIDDVRPLVITQRRRIDAYMDDATWADVSIKFGYIFATPPGSQYPPLLNKRRIAPGEVVQVDGAGGPVAFRPFRLLHGDIDALGLRLGAVAYTPDVHAIPDESLPFLADLDTWIIDCLRPRPHPSHFSLSEALAWVERMKPKRAVLTNLHSDLDYEQLRQGVRAGIEPAFDGLQLAIGNA